MIRIAIDGPGGAGKSSLAKAVAKQLGIIYVDTGALYRTIGVFMLNNNVEPNDAEAVTSLLHSINLEMKFENGQQIILLNGNPVGEEIRTPEASMAASAVSAIASVRSFLLMTQRNIAENNSVIMDGRDIGTVILPRAEVKIFLTASPEARAKRRFAELTAEQTVAEVIKIVKKEQKKRKKKGSALYLFLRAIIAPFYRFFARVHVVGKENIPKDGGAIICCNHIGVNDIFLLGCVFPRQIHFLAKKEWFSVPVLKTLFKALGAVKLDRGGKDVGALKNAVNLVNQGKTIAIFPQGHRFPGENPANTPIKNGVGLIAYHSHGDVIPVCIKTKDVKYKFLRKIEIIFGKPIKFSELGFENGGYGEYKNATEIMFRKVCELGGYSKDESLPEGEAEDA